MEFEELKSYLVFEADKCQACADGLHAGRIAQNMDELLLAIRDNFRWLMRNKIINVEFLEAHFTHRELTDKYIYTQGTYDLYEIVRPVIVCGNGEIFAVNCLHVEAFDNSLVRTYEYCEVHAYDDALIYANDYTSVRASNNSNIKAFDNACIRAEDKSKILAYGHCRVYACDGSRVIASNYSTIIVYDSAHCEADEYSIVHNFSKNTMVIKSVNAIVINTGIISKSIDLLGEHIKVNRIEM
jgi:hypothetical protein